VHSVVCRGNRLVAAVNPSIKVKGNIHLPPATPKRIREIGKEKIDDKCPQQSQNAEDLIEIIEKNVPTGEQRMKFVGNKYRS